MLEVFGVFEGGGAKGLAHVGALKALEERGIVFRAVAGTSIGAIVAALVAARFTSADLFDVQDGVEVGLLSEDLEARLLDPDEYRRVTRLRRHMGLLASREQDGLAGRFRAWLASIARRRLRLAWLLGVAAANLSFVAYVMHSRILGDLWTGSGAVDTRRVRDWLDATLRDRLGLPHGRRVTFEDLPIELRVVATDLTNECVRLFSRTATPAMPVADAVAASMAYPLFFKPVEIDGSVLVDGGLASNAPAWVLDDLRDTADARIPTIAFRLLDPDPETQATPAHATDALLLVRLLRRFLSSVLGSRTALETRRIDELHLMELRADVGTLEFERVNRHKAATVEKGLVGVREYLRRRIGPRDPKTMEAALRAFGGAVGTLTRNEGLVRSYLVQSLDDVSCRVIYSAMLEQDGDDALIMRSDSRSQALSLALREPVMIRTSEVSTVDRTVAATKYLHAIRPREVTHVLCTPIFASRAEWSLTDPMERSDPVATLCFDFRTGDDRLLLEPTIEDGLAAVAQIFGEFWTERFDADAPFDVAEAAPDMPAAGDWTPVPDAPGFFVSGRKTRSPPSERLQVDLDLLVRRIGA